MESFTFTDGQVENLLFALANDIQKQDEIINQCENNGHLHLLDSMKSRLSDLKKLENLIGGY